MIFKVTTTYLLLIIVLINLAETRFTDVPSPPERPKVFRTREELQRYLQKVHEYHLIVDRWRLRRDHGDHHSSLSASDDDLFHFFDINNDRYISKNEFTQRLRFNKKEE